MYRVCDSTSVLHASLWDGMRTSLADQAGVGGVKVVATTFPILSEFQQ